MFHVSFIHYIFFTFSETCYIIFVIFTSDTQIQVCLRLTFAIHIATMSASCLHLQACVCVQYACTFPLLAVRQLCQTLIRRTDGYKHAAEQVAGSRGALGGSRDAENTGRCAQCFWTMWLAEISNSHCNVSCSMSVALTSHSTGGTESSEISHGEQEWVHRMSKESGRGLMNHTP